MHNTKIQSNSYTHTGSRLDRREMRIFIECQAKHNFFLFLALYSGHIRRVQQNFAFSNSTTYSFSCSLWIRNKFFPWFQ